MTRFLTLSAVAAALAGLPAGDMLGLNRAVAATIGAATLASATAAGEKAAGDAAPAASGEVTRAFLIGRWTDNDDCTSTIAFLPDGRFVTAAGEGLWLLEGDQLTMQGQSAITVRVRAPDANTIMLKYADGRLGRSTRCPD
jgi:hypothetical protein